MTLNVAELNRALADDQLVPHFQPIVELRTGRLSGFEVLARWMHPLHGAVLPSNLIELAEENGLVATVAQQVFSKAFLLVAAVPETLKLSVNLSPMQLAHSDLSHQIEGMASNAGFSLHRLTIEITESALLTDLTGAKGIAHELKELGCRLSLDDFGTGYSSLAHLHALPFDELKIDRCFVSRMTEKRESRKIVAAIIGLGHSLGLDTVAEGIETAEQADMLLWLGSELGQGWHYGRPASFDVIRSMVKAGPVASRLNGPAEDLAVSSLEAYPTQRLAQLQAIYDGVPVGLCFLDRDMRYVSLNRRLAEINASSVAAHLGNTVREMIPASYANLEPYLLRALQGEAISGVEVPRPTFGSKDNGWVMIYYQPAFDEADEVIGVSICVLDITEHKRAQDELSEIEFAQRQLVEFSHQVPWTMDSEGNNLQLSSQWVTELASGNAQTRNPSWMGKLHPDDLKLAIAEMKEALLAGERIDMEYRVQTTEGAWRWMRLRGLPRLGQNGEITRWYGSVEDIHEKKSAEVAASKTEAEIRALLRAVPVAIIIEEGKSRTVQMFDDTFAEVKGVHAHLDVNLQEGKFQNIVRPAVKILDHLFRAKETAPLPTTGARLKKKQSVTLGLQVVNNVHLAANERQRLVTMLKEFAEQRMRDS